MRIEIPKLADTWPRILPGLEELRARGDCDWELDEVRADLEEGEALLLVDAEDSEAGFAIVRVREYRYDTDDLELYVWLAWSKVGNAIERYLSIFEHAAHEAGAKWIRFWSSRAGMPRLAADAGFLIHSVEYVKEL